MKKRKQAGPELVLLGGWTCVEARLSPNTSSFAPLSPHPPHRHFIHLFILWEGLFTFDKSVFSHFFFSSQMGGAVHHHSWGTQIFMQPPLHRHKPVVTKAQTPTTPRCGIGLKKPDFAQQSDHQPPKTTTSNVIYFPRASFPPLFSSGLSMSVAVSGAGASPSVKTCVGVGGGGGSPWRIIDISTLLYAFSLFTVLPCLIMFKQHCTGLWQRRDASCASLTRLHRSQTHDIISLQRKNSQPWMSFCLQEKADFDFQADVFGTKNAKNASSPLYVEWLNAKILQQP